MFLLLGLFYLALQLAILYDSLQQADHLRLDLIGAQQRLVTFLTVIDLRCISVVTAMAA